jgi:DNA invertase Pin-like site-specific DNA recombinase
MVSPALTRVAIYGRVSIDDIAQDLESELMQLRAWCAYNHCVVVDEYVDRESAGKKAYRQTERARLFADAARQKCDMVLVFSLDDFSWKGVGPTIVDIQRLARCGVAFHSYAEDHLCTDNEAVSGVLIRVIDSLARLERQKISKGTKAGLRRARARGKRLGRAPFSDAQLKKLRAALDTGENWHRVSRSTGIPYSTVQKHARRQGYEAPGG